MSVAATARPIPHHRRRRSPSVGGATKGGRTPGPRGSGGLGGVAPWGLMVAIVVGPGQPARSLPVTDTRSPGSAEARTSNADASGAACASSGVARTFTSYEDTARRYEPTDSHSVTRHHWPGSS